MQPILVMFSGRSTQRLPVREAVGLHPGLSTNNHDANDCYGRWHCAVPVLFVQGPGKRSSLRLGGCAHVGDCFNGFISSPSTTPSRGLLRPRRPEHFHRWDCLESFEVRVQKVQCPLNLIESP